MNIKRIHYDSLDLNIFIVTSFLLFIGVLSFIFLNPELLTLSLIFVHCVFFFKFFNTPSILFIFLFSFLHALVYYDFFVLNRPISFWGDFQSENYLSISLFCHLLFIFVLGNVLSHFELVNAVKFNFRIYFQHHHFIFSALSVIGLYIIVYGITGETIASGAYANGNQVKSSIFEYFILVYLFLIIFSKRIFIHYSVLFLLFIGYSIKAFLYGARIEVLQLVLLVFLIFYDSNKSISFTKLLLSIFFLLYINSLVGFIRANPMLLFENNWSEILNPFVRFSFSTSSSSFSSTEGDVVQSSARMVGLIEVNELPIEKRMFGFFYFIFSPFLPSSLLPDYVSLASYKQSNYESGGGGLISSYFFVWLGYFGPIVISFILGIIINYFFIYRTVSKTLFIYGFCLLSTFPRWHSFNPILIVKFSFYGVVFYLILRYFLSFVKSFPSITSYYKK